jgi:hypothetical protein
MTESRHHPQKATKANKSYYYYTQRITHKKTEAFSGLLVKCYSNPSSASCCRLSSKKYPEGLVTHTQ